MALTPGQIKARSGKLTASEMSTLMSGDEQALYRLWQRLIDDPDYKADDLSGVWPVQLGSVTEQLNLDWYARKRGCEVTRRGEVVVMEDPSWAACTLDGWDSVRNIPIECKHVGGREPLSRVTQRYQPQCQWQMFVTGTDSIAFSVIEAANEPVIQVLQYDGVYGEEMYQRAIEFMACVDTLTPPVALPPIDAPVIATKEQDMSTSNAWAAFAGTWIETIEAAEKNEEAGKELKLLVPRDVQRAHGRGVEITRDRANRMRLRRAA